MTILQRYIAKTIMLASAAVLFVMLGLTFFIGLLGELRDIGTGDYQFLDAVLHTLLKLPHDLYQFFPMMIMLGGVMGLGILSSHRELIVMRTSGVSVQNIIGGVLAGGALLILIATVIGEGLAPQAIYLGDKHKQGAENYGQAVATASGVWIHEGNNFLHVERVMSRHHLEGVKRYEFDKEHRLLAAYYAKKLDFENGHWELTDLSKTTFLENETRSERVAKASWGLVLNPNLLNIGMVEPQQLSLDKLLKYSRHLVKNHLQATRFQFEFWKRIFQPLASLVMLLLAVPFVLGAPRSVTMGWRMLLGVMVGFSFYMLNAFLGQLSIVYQLSPFFAAFFPVLLFGILGYVLIAWRF